MLFQLISQNQLLNHLKRRSSETSSSWVGVVSLEDVQAYAVNQLKVPKEVTNGVVLGKIYPISPAEKAGLEQYDIVVALDNQKVENSLQFRKYLYEKKK